MPIDSKSAPRSEASSPAQNGAKTGFPVRHATRPVEVHGRLDDAHLGESGTARNDCQTVGVRGERFDRRLEFVVPRGGAGEAPP